HRVGGASRPGQQTSTGDRSGRLAGALDRLSVPDLAAGQGTAPAGGRHRDRLPDHPTRLVSDPVNVPGHRARDTPPDAVAAVRYASSVLRQFYFWYGYRPEARPVARQVLH